MLGARAANYRPRASVQNFNPAILIGAPIIRRKRRSLQRARGGDRLTNSVSGLDHASGAFASEEMGAGPLGCVMANRRLAGIIARIFVAV
jgi:hypothetical protein